MSGFYRYPLAMQMRLEGFLLIKKPPKPHARNKLECSSRKIRRIKVQGNLGDALNN